MSAEDVSPEKRVYQLPAERPTSNVPPVAHVVGQVPVARWLAPANSIRRPPFFATAALRPREPHRCRDRSDLEVLGYLRRALTTI